MIQEQERKTVTIDELANEAKTCFLRFKAWRKQHTADNVCDPVLKEMHREHKEFSHSYPIVLRYMAMGEYSDAAFRKYIKWTVARQKTVVAEMSDQAPDKRMERLEIENLNMQAEYAVFLFKETHRRWDQTQIANLRHNISASLRQEHDAFKQAMKESENRIDALERLLDVSLRAETSDYYRAAGGPIDPTRVEVQTYTEAAAGDEPQVEVVPPPVDSNVFF